MKQLDAFLDSITMYRLLLYYLIGLLMAAVGLSASGILHYQPLDIVFSALYICAICWVTNKAFAWAFRAPTNVESPYITGLILALIVSPTHTSQGLVFLTVAGALAMATKYILAFHGRHFFNPAAIAVVLTSVMIGQAASWWVGTASMLPFVLIGGFLLIRRIRRAEMALWFIGSATIATCVYAILNGSEPLAIVEAQSTSSALFFMAAVMLTEPLTSPTTRGKRIWYSVLVGGIFPPQFAVLGLRATPELALIVGNIFSYIVGPRVKTFLKLTKKTNLSHDSIDFAFTPERPFTYTPGQYMEFTFQHPNTDARGARRYFTLASSPTEPQVHIGLKFYQPSSSFKREIRQATSKTRIIAGQLGGDFTLPKDTTQKIVCIAGGIGITPFRSMLKYLTDTNQKRDIVLLYAARTAQDIVYRDIFDQAARALGVRVVYLVDSGETVAPFRVGRITPELIREIVPDFAERLFYISGPHGMVVGTSESLRRMGVPAKAIKKDFFSGYA